MAYLELIFSKPFIIVVNGKRKRFPRLWFTWTTLINAFRFDKENTRG